VGRIGYEVLILGHCERVQPTGNPPSWPPRQCQCIFFEQAVTSPEPGYSFTAFTLSFFLIQSLIPVPPSYFLSRYLRLLATALWLSNI
jgi:hypothetical protein